MANQVEIITEDKIPELDSFIASHPKGHFMQTSLWAKQKPEWAWAALAKRNDAGEIVGSLSFLIRKVPGLPFTLMYGCRGPVCDPEDLDTARDLFAASRTLAKRFRAYLIKIDPDLPVGEPSATLARALTDNGFRLAGSGKNFEGAQPRFVFRLDIAGKTEDELLQSFESKTRYNIRLAVRKGVVVKNVGKDGVADFARLMVETGLRDNFTVRQESYFANMLDNLGEHARLYMAYIPDENGGETPIAGTLAIHWGDKVWYLYGASSNAHRNYMPNYLLQWTMIRWALELGCRMYDFRGVSGDLDESNPLYGLYRFKKGFGGDFTEFMGEYDYVISPLIEKGVALGKKAMHKIASRRFKAKNSGAEEKKEAAPAAE